jgi:glycine cleavage system H protein
VSDLYAPLGGEVVEVNSQVSGNVQLLAEDPFEKGWLVKIKVTEPLDTSGLMDLFTYEKKVAEEGH